MRNKLLRLARQDVSKGDLRSAHRRYKRLTGLEPDSTTFQMRLADVSLKLGRKQEAVETYRHAGLLFTRTAFEKKAIGVFKRALEIDADRIDVSELIADAYQRLDLPGDAIACLQSMVETLMGRDQRLDAARLQRRIAELDPTDVSSRLALAHNLEMDQLNEQAVLEYVECIVALVEQGSVDRVASVFQAVVALEPPEAADLAKLVDDSHEPDPDAADRDKILVCRAYDDAIEQLYRRVARVYRRQAGFRTAS